MKSPILPAASELLKNPAQSGTSVTRWAEYKWSMEWRENASRLHTFILDHTLKMLAQRHRNLFLFYLYIYPPDLQESDGGATA